MEQELESYIYILDKQENSAYNIISFDATLCGARKTMAKVVKHEKYTLETTGAKVYAAKARDGNSVTLFRSTPDRFDAGGPKTISIKRVSSRPVL